jgi:hypothetical protein
MFLGRVTFSVAAGKFEQLLRQGTDSVRSAGFPRSPTMSVARRLTAGRRRNLLLEPDLGH